MRQHAKFSTLTDKEVSQVGGGYGADLKPGKYYWDKNGNDHYDDGKKAVFIEPKFEQLGDGGGDPMFYDGWALSEAKYLSDDGSSGAADPALTPPDLNCLSEGEISQLTAEQRGAYYIAVEAAEIAREILLQPNHDSIEWASIIYRDDNGVITHTPIQSGGPVSVAASQTGMSNLGQFLGIVHSHTAAQFVPDIPQFKLFPTPNAMGTGGLGDWSPLDYYRSEMQTSLIAEGLTAEEAALRSESVYQFVLGPTAPIGTNQYELRGYSVYDRDTVTLGQKVNLNLGLCGS